MINFIDHIYNERTNTSAVKIDLESRIYYYSIEVEKENIK